MTKTSHWNHHDDFDCSDDFDEHDLNCNEDCDEHDCHEDSLATDNGEVNLSGECVFLAVILSVDPPPLWCDGAYITSPLKCSGTLSSCTMLA